MNPHSIRTYPAALDRVVDGDTVDLIVDLGFRAALRIRFRMRGIDTPEPKGVTRAMGLKATAFLGALLEPTRERLTVASHGEVDKYGGRWDGQVFFPTLEVLVDAAERMLKLGYAQAYDGTGPRPTWDPSAPYPLRVAQ